MVLYERHIQVSVLTEPDKCSKFAHWISMAETSPFLSVCSNESHIVLRCTYNESQVRAAPGQKKRWAWNMMAKREKRAEGGGGRRRRSRSSASPILMCFFDRPWNYAWWFLKCFNWSGPKLEPNSILGGRQYVCFFCLFCSVLFCSQDAKVGNPIKIPKAFTLLEKIFFSAAQAEFFVCFKAEKNLDAVQKGDGKLTKWTNFLAV